MSIVKQFTSVSSLCVVIGTIAFGMGIDSPDVRAIIHSFGVFQTIVRCMCRSQAVRGGTGYSRIRSMERETLYISAQMIKYCSNGAQCRRELTLTIIAKMMWLILCVCAVMYVCRLNTT